MNEYLDSLGVDLKKEQHVPLHTTLDIDPAEFVDFMNIRQESKTTKWYHPRPFLDARSNIEMQMINDLGYCAQNTTEENWGLDQNDNSMLKEMVGEKNISKLGIDPDKILIRLLKYAPGQILPLHRDGKEGWQRLYGKGDPVRFSVAVSEWSWGHFIQVHDKMLHKWKPGDTYLIPSNVWHCSGNCGIEDKITLTITGVWHDKG